MLIMVGDLLYDVPKDRVRPIGIIRGDLVDQMDAESVLEMYDPANPTYEIGWPESPTLDGGLGI